MGKSNSIKTQQEKNKEFQNYVEQMTANMDKRQAALDSELSKMEEAHYASFPDKALLIEGRYSHLTTVSEWSLKTISNIIDSCSKAIFGTKKDAPGGSEKKDTNPEVSKSIEAVKQREELIANAAFDVVQAIVGSFSCASSTSVEKKVDGKPIAPGMTLFVGVENNSFSSSGFLRSENIIQTIFVFKVYYSIKEGQAQSSLSDLQLYEDQKETYRRIIAEINKLIENLDVSSDDFEELSAKYEERADRMYERLDKINEKIKELTAYKLEAEKAACAQLVENIHSVRPGLMAADNSIHTRTSTGFTFTGTWDTADTLIKANTPSRARLDKLMATDYSGNHYKAIFKSTSPISLDEANSWVRRALEGKGNFHFD